MKKPLVMGFSALASLLLAGAALAQPDPDDLEVTMSVAEPDAAVGGSQMDLQEDGNANDVDDGQADDIDDGQADDVDDGNADDVDDGEANDGDDGDANDVEDGDANDGGDDNPAVPGG